MKCYICGCDDVGWEADFSADEYGYEQEGIIHEYSCKQCGSQITIFEPIEVKGESEND